MSVAVLRDLKDDVLTALRGWGTGVHDIGHLGREGGKEKRGGEREEMEGEEREREREREREKFNNKQVYSSLSMLTKQNDK